MIRHTNALVFALLLSLCPLAAQAGDPLSYSYLDGQYLNTTRTVETNGKQVGKDDKFEGYRLGVNLSVYKFVYFTADLDHRRAQGFRSGFQSVGFGAHTMPNFTRHLQLFGNATYERSIYNDVTNIPTAPKDDKDEGYGIEAGIRAPWESFEAHASYRYLNYGETQKVKVSGGKYGAGLVAQITPYFALTGDYRRLDIDFKGVAQAKESYDEYLVGFRAYFATDIDRWRRRGGIFGEEAAPSAATPAEASAE